MKILFIEPPYKMFMASLDAPFTLMILAAIAEKHGWEAEILDMANLETSIPEADVYAVTSSSPQWPDTVKLSRILKNKYPDKPCVVGGNHISAEPNDIWQTNFDHGFLGEGEIKLGEYLDSFDGTGYGEDDWHRLIMGTPVENLDNLPFPARHLVDWRKYRRGIFWGKKRLSNAVSMVSSRGCPFGCCYCGSKVVFGRRTRFRSVGNVVEEIQYVKDNMAYWGFNFHDDTFCLDRKRVHVLNQAFHELNIVYRCLNRVDRTTKKSVEDLAYGGCREVVLGLEYFSQECLDAVGKGVTVKQNKRALKLVKDNPEIQVKAGLIVGGPRYSWKAHKDHVKAIRECPPDFWAVSVFTTYPGSDVWYNPEKYGLRILTRDLTQYAMVTGDHYRGIVNIESDLMSKKDIELSRDILIDTLIEESGAMYENE